MIDIDKLRELLAAATPGEWRATKPTGAFDAYKPPYIKANDRRVAIVDSSSSAYGVDIADAALICAAVNALPELLAIAEAACGYVDRERLQDTGADNRENSRLEDAALVSFAVLAAAVDAARKEGK